MIAIQTICESIANALASSATIAAYCTTNFGRGLRVCLGSVGSYDEDDEGQSRNDAAKWRGAPGEPSGTRSIARCTPGRRWGDGRDAN